MCDLVMMTRGRYQQLAGQLVPEMQPIAALLAEAHAKLAALLEKMGKKEVGRSLEVSWTIY